MGRLSDTERTRNKEATRAAMDRLLRGELPPGGRCDLKTLAAEAGVSRTGFYPKKNRDGSPRPGPYQHLAEEFERRLAALREAGTTPDPRAAQVERLKEQVTTLKDRLAERDRQAAEFTDFQQRALSRIAAQQMEISRLREALASPSNVQALPIATTRSTG